MTKSILILGAGGHSKVVIETALAINLYDKIAILDDKFTGKNKENNYILNHPIIGKFNKVLSRELKDLYNYAFVALGNSEERLHWLKILKQNNYKVPNLIHPRSYISKSSNFGKGILVAANASIQSSTNLQDGVIVNTGATVDHDCDLNKGVHICPGVNLAGNVKVGSKSWIGIGSCVIENIAIGESVLVGAGSSVISDLPNNVKAFGSPAKISDKIH